MKRQAEQETGAARVCTGGVQGVYAWCIAIFAAFPAMAQPITVPSGQPLEFIEVISEEEGALVRFRFLAPEIGSDFTYEEVSADFQVLCDELALPALEANALAPAQIVLSMSAKAVPFGEPAPEVLQFFEIFRPEEGACIWEEF